MDKYIEVRLETDRLQAPGPSKDFFDKAVCLRIRVRDQHGQLDDRSALIWLDAKPCMDQDLVMVRMTVQSFPDPAVQTSELKSCGLSATLQPRSSEFYELPRGVTEHTLKHTDDKQD